MNELDFKLLSVLNETHNISKAANMLFKTQSALSKRISVLEQELDITLFIRTRQGIRFTPEGEQVLAYVNKAMEQMQMMRNSLSAQSGKITGSLNLGVTNNYALYCINDILVPYRQRYPDVTVNIITDHSRKIFSRLEDDSVDLAIVRGEFHWNEQKILLKRENICAIRSQKDKDKTLYDIPYIGRLTDKTLSRKIHNWLTENQLPKDPPKMNVENIVTCVSMVEQGLGWAIVPEIVLSGFTGCVTPLITKDGEPLVHNTYLMYSDSLKKLPQVSAFIETVLFLSQTKDDQLS